jgi:replicative DNA helicase
MLARNLVSRKFSNSLRMTVQELHSGKEDTAITDAIFKQIQAQAEALKKYPITYVDVPGTVEEIYNTIMNFSKLPENSGRGIVVMLDHSILVKGQKSELERTILVELMTMFNYLKKEIKIITILLSQLNRDIESTERLTNPNMHFPKKKDLFASDSLYQFSDMVTIIMNPEQLGLETYGPRQWPVKGALYLHVIKAREGEPTILRMVNLLKYNQIIDYYAPNDVYNLSI